MLGFIGTGAVTEAVVTGLSTAPGPPPDIVLSPRSAGRAAALARRFANVAVADDNAMVLALADTVVLALRPHDAAAALAPLRFRPEQTVVSVMALVPMARLKALLTPAERICRALPLPAAALRAGPVALWPALADVAALLGRVGTVVPVAEEAQLEALWATTALTAPFYETLDGIARWLVERGVPQAQATDYVAGLVAAWGAATAGQRDFARLRAESQTRGGLNEQAMALLAAQGHFTRLHETLDAVLARLTTAESSEK